MVEVIPCGIPQRAHGLLSPPREGRGTHTAAQLGEVTAVARMALLILRGKAVKADVLLPQALGRGGEAIAHTGLCGDAPPERAARRGGILGQREAVLIGLVAIGKDILRDLPKVDEERAATCRRLIDEGIHQPALEVVDPRLVEVCLVYSPHDPRPAALGLGDIALGGEGGVIEVVGATLPRVVAKGERREIARLAEELLAVGIELRAQHVADEVVADEVGVVAYVGGRLAAAVLGEYRVDAEPRE